MAGKWVYLLVLPTPFSLFVGSFRGFSAVVNHEITEIFSFFCEGRLT
jgi:hypothetical protein